MSASGAEKLPGNPNMTYYDLINKIYGEEYPLPEKLEEWGVAGQTFQDLFNVSSHRTENMLVT